MTRASCMAVVWALCWTAAPAVAKPLYITVPRAFATDEAPVIDLAFAERDPALLRVLKPASMGAFVAQQFNLRRAYMQPQVLLNPGRALSRGINAVHNPGRFLLYALNPEFRAEIAPALPKRADSAISESLVRVGEGARKLVDAPAGMVKVHEEYLNLDLGGTDRAFSVPGFEVWNGSSGYQERHVSLAPLPAGVYVLQLVQGMVEGQAVLVVTDLAVQAKQTDGKVLVRVANGDQTAVPEAMVTAYGPSGKSVQGKTDGRGEVRLETDDRALLITAQHAADTAVLDTDFYSTLATTPDVFIYSDRPMYRPGDSVNFRGILRKPASFLAELFSPRRPMVNVTCEAGDKTLTAHVPSDDFGAFSGVMTLPADAPAGVVRLYADVDGRQHRAEARVQEYVKPTFFVELLTDAGSVTPGSNLTVHARARRYAGGVPKNAVYDVYLYRTILDTPTWVDDAGLGAQGSAITYGNQATQEGALNVPTRLYSSVVARQTRPAFDYENTWSSALQFDPNGEADIVVPVPALEKGDEQNPFTYTLTVRARDADKAQANASRTFVLAHCDVQGQLTADAKLLQQNANTTLSIRALTLANKPAPSTTGELTFMLDDAQGKTRTLRKEVFQTDSVGVYRAPWPTSDVGTVRAEVTLQDASKRLWRDSKSLWVVGEGGQMVTRVPALALTTLSDAASPGDKVKVVGLLPENWGPQGGAHGKIWMTLVGQTIHATDQLDVDGHTFTYEFPVEKRFGSAVYIQAAYPTATGKWEERSTSLRIVPKERVLSVSLQPDESEVLPLAEQTMRLFVRDSDGHGVVAQVSLSVVDKAVYALQPEFRPGVVDFFYPLVRNNVMSFFSSDFQGYGHGEYLARLLRGTLPYEFAAIKPPSHQAHDKERDTALWKADIVTDVHGTAEISFPMPANQTLWTATAVAADVRGRFGEGTCEFASRGDISLNAALPPFLRAGDTAQGVVRIARGAQQGGAPGDTIQRVAEAYTVQGVMSGALHDDKTVKTLQLQPGGEEGIPVALKTRSPGGGIVDVGLSSAHESLTDRRRIAVQPACVRMTSVTSVRGAGEVRLQAPAGASVTQASLVLMPGSVAAAIDSVHELLNEPFGDLQYLVATTVPNLALYQVLDLSGARRKLDADSQALLEEAHSRAVQGVQRIMALATTMGGFTWFNGYDTPDVGLTLMAMEGLGYAAEAKLIDAHDTRLIAASRYLSAADLPFALDAARAYVLTRLYGADEAPRVRALIDRATGNDLYGNAMTILAARQSGVAREDNAAAKVAKLVVQSRDALTQLATYSIDRDTFWSYPLQRAGLTALVTRAALGDSKEDSRIGEARQRFMEALASEDVSPFERANLLLQNMWLLQHDAQSLTTGISPQVTTDDGFVTLTQRGAGFGADVSQITGPLHVAAFDGVTQLRATLEVPFASAQAQSHGMSLTRRYYRVHEGTKVAIEPNQAVAVGADVFVELAIDAHDSATGWLRSAYYSVQDGIPAGFVAVEEDKVFRTDPYNLPLTHSALKRRRFDVSSVTLDFEEPAWWQDSPRVVGYMLRAQFPGTFSAPPASLKDRFAPTVGAQTTAAQLTVAGAS